jgi:hypothetical protein
MFHMQRWAVTTYLNYGLYLNFTDIFFSQNRTNHVALVNALTLSY